MLPYTVTVQATGNQPINVPVSSHPDTRAIVILNDSAFDIDAMLSGSNQHCPVVPGIGDAFLVRSGFSGTVQLNVNPYFASSVQNSALANVVKIYTYAHDEPLTQALMKGLPTGYPISVPRLFGLGGGVLNTLSNETSAYASKIVDIGSGSNNDLIDMYNSGQVTWKTYNQLHNILTSVFQIIPRNFLTDPAFEMQSKFQVDQGVTFAVGTAFNTLNGIAFGMGTTSAAGNVVITHGLGTTPGAILLTEVNNVNDIMSVTNVGATTFQANVSVGAVRSFYWLALA